MKTNGHNSEKRVSGRLSVKIPIRCVPIGSVSAEPCELELWTHDIHPQGVGLEWYISTKPQVCPSCESLVRDFMCSKIPCPYKTFKSTLMDSGWLQIHGLNRIPGWEKEEKVLGKVIWFKMSDEGVGFQLGVKFNRVKSPISPKNIPSGETETLEVKTWRVKNKLQNKLLVFDEDPSESNQILSLSKNLGFIGKRVFVDYDILDEILLSSPKVVFIDPVSRNIPNMELLKMIKGSASKTHVALLIQEKFKDMILDDPLMRRADSIFMKPLDFVRVKDLLKKFT